MKEVYLAYFDYLGFQEFIEKNPDDVLIRRMGHIFRDTEGALGQGKYNEPQNGVVLSDLSHTNLSCLNISDTVVYWTNECNFKSLKELIQVAYQFNWMQNSYNFPVRGSIVKGKIKIVSGQHINSHGGSYSVQCLYGKGLIKAHNKAQYQNWAGTVLDPEVISDLEDEPDGIPFLSEFAVKYKVPYKSDIGLGEEYVFKLIKEISNETIRKNLKDDVIRVFALDNKSTKSENVELKINNTLNFIEFLAGK